MSADMTDSLPSSVAMTAATEGSRTAVRAHLWYFSGPRWAGRTFAHSMACRSIWAMMPVVRSAAWVTVSLIAWLQGEGARDVEASEDRARHLVHVHDHIDVSAYA